MRTKACWRHGRWLLAACPPTLLGWASSARAIECNVVAPQRHDGGVAHLQAVEFITNEMIVNSGSDDVEFIQDNVNGLCQGGLGFDTGCHPLALQRWASQVCSNCEWDHKPVIRAMFGGDYSDIPNLDAELYFDVWSNIHYGYVGTHAGISAFELQTAANLRIPGVTGTNDAVDAITVQIGIDLRAQYAPDELTPSIVSAAMLARLDDMCLDDYHIHYFDSFVDGFGPAPEEGFGVLCDPASPNPPRACGALDDEFAAERDLVRVSAGPNVSGNVDAAIALRGSAEPVPESVSWRYTAGQNVPAGASCSFSDSAALQTEIRCDRPGTYVATVAARYGDQNISDSAVVWVRNVAPRVTLVSPAPWRVFERGRKLTLEGSIADSAYDSHDCTVDWDDGSSAESFAAAGERCLRAHVFDKPGMYSLRLRVTDSAGARDDESVLVIVTDDDDAGSLRVDGESYVAAGAAGAEVASLARLEASATVERHGPSGTLKFDAGALRLRAKEPDWFLVTEDGRSAVAGQGRIDGVGDVGFLLLAEQGCEAHGAGHRGRGGRHSCAEPTPHAARTVIWRLIDGAYPSPQIPRVFDSAVGTNYDIDEALLSPLASGDVDVEPGRSQH